MKNWGGKSWKNWKNLEDISWGPSKSKQVKALFWWKMTLDEDNSWKNTTFDGKQHFEEDNLTFQEKHPMMEDKPLMEDDLWYGRYPLIEDL